MRTWMPFLCFPLNHTHMLTHTHTFICHFVLRRMPAYSIHGETEVYDALGYDTVKKMCEAVKTFNTRVSNQRWVSRKFIKVRHLHLQTLPNFVRSFFPQVCSEAETAAAAAAASDGCFGRPRSGGDVQ